MFTQTKREETREEACVNGLASLAHKDIRFRKPKFTNKDFDSREPEGLFHQFDTLSEAFFGGALKRGENVSLAWADGDPGTEKKTFGFTTARGAVSENGNESSVIKITLNRDLCSCDTNDREGKALAALIHQMGHAYFMLCNGAKYSDDIHDECFKALMFKISDIWAAYEDELAAFIILSVGPKVKLTAGIPKDHCAWIYHPDTRPVFPRRVIMWQEVSHLYKRATDLADEMGDFMEGTEEDQKKKKKRGKRMSQIRDFFTL
ncbi:hypothetical protein KEM56_007870 [Ascosphaera pollenicola]|nr:hypothetical protein KEM56_007870 [Ascosphaera pollenicola]